MGKIAAIQLCSSNLVDENLNSTARLIEKAANAGAILAVLPEMFAIIEPRSPEKAYYKEAPYSGKIQTQLSRLAKKYNIWIVGGTLPMAIPCSNKIRAACLVFDNQGEQVARYDKINLFDATFAGQEVYKESNITEPGDQIVVVDTPLGKLGLCVCYDIRFPRVFTQLVEQGAEIIAIPAAFTMQTGSAHWELLARCRAIDSFSYVVGACQGGIHANGRQTYGHSMIVNPWGAIIAEIQSSGENIITADIDLQALYEIRKQIPTFPQSEPVREL